MREPQPGPMNTDRCRELGCWSGAPEGLARCARRSASVVPDGRTGARVIKCAQYLASGRRKVLRSPWERGSRVNPGPNRIAPSSQERRPDPGTHPWEAVQTAHHGFSRALARQLPVQRSQQAPPRQAPRDKALGCRPADAPQRVGASQRRLCEGVPTAPRDGCGIPTCGLSRRQFIPDTMVASGRAGASAPSCGARHSHAQSAGARLRRRRRKNRDAPKGRRRCSRPGPRPSVRLAGSRPGAARASRATRGPCGVWSGSSPRDSRPLTDQQGREANAARDARADCRSPRRICGPQRSRCRR